MTTQPLDPAAAAPAVVARPIAFDDIPRATWDALLGRTAMPTPFSRWTFHRAWWDAYASTAHEQYLVCEQPGSAMPMAIVPLMHRHEVEPGDALTATTLRRGSASGSSVPPDAKAVFMAASYHADYATVLVDPADAETVAHAVVRSLSGPPDTSHGDREWDVIDLRRWRRGDPALDALEAAFRARVVAEGWEVRREQEDVCPVSELDPAGWDAFLGSLDKTARHEVRRKLRRAAAQGQLDFRLVSLDRANVDRFIDLHQARWGAAGLFPPTDGGDRSRRFVHRLAELEAGEGERSQLQIGDARVGERTVFMALGFDDGTTCYFYNAGLDPAARDVSPGITGTALYIRGRLEAGRRRFDFLRGHESYKYEWGARDEPVDRLLVLRAAGR